VDTHVGSDASDAGTSERKKLLCVMDPSVFARHRGRKLLERVRATREAGTLDLGSGIWVLEAGFGMEAVNVASCLDTDDLSRLERHSFTATVYVQRACGDIHTYIHTYVHTYVHTYIHAYMHTYRQCYQCRMVGRAWQGRPVFPKHVCDTRA
jgi:hypothetical protein